MKAVRLERKAPKRESPLLLEMEKQKRKRRKKE